MSSSGRESLQIERWRDRPRRLQLLSWLAALVVGAWIVVLLYPVAFPWRIDGWQVQRAEAKALARAAALDLGDLPADAYVSATLTSRQDLELRLLRSADAMAVAHSPERAQLLPESAGLHSWQVAIYEPGAAVDQWAYRAQIAPDGRLLSLVQRAPADFSSTVTLDTAEAISRAGDFLRREGVDPDRFAAPTVRRIDLETFTYTLVRYEERTGQIDSGIEVRFSGDVLRGFANWIGEADEDVESVIAAETRSTTLLQAFHLLVPFLFVPFLALYFFRLYHRGVVGVRNAGRVFYVMLSAAIVLVVLVAGAVSEGSSMGNVSRAQMTRLVAILMIAIYFPALAALALMSSALGESAAVGRWRRRLASFDALIRLRWMNATVAVAGLRGTTGGVWLAAVLLASAALVSRLGIHAPFASFFGPWWQAAPLPGVALVLVMLIYTGIYCCLGLLLPLRPFSDRFGPWLGGLLVAVLATMVFFPPLNLAPTWASLVFSFAAAVYAVVVYLRYDLLTALLTSLVSAVLLGALPLLHAVDPALQVQGLIALAVVTLPFWLPLRQLDGGPAYSYQWDDVPPHVRRIAERERHRVEIENARDVQSTILPRLPESLNGVELAHIYLPAGEIGGDFYDVIPLDDGRLAVAIGDVAGHGVPSGLIMSMVRAALAVQVGFRPEVEDVLSALNRVVHRTAQRRLLTTLCYLVLDPTTGGIRWSSAGHIHPYRVSSSGSVQPLESAAYPLGVRADLRVQGRRAQLDPGDSLFLCSDGLVEAARPGSDEPFGFERLEESLYRSAGRSAEALLDQVFADVGRFVGQDADRAARGGETALQDWAGEDDLTAVVLRLS